MSAEVWVPSWQLQLAAEHAAVFGYRRLGPDLTEEVLTALARGDEQVHQQRRDQLIASLLASGATPVAPQANYPLSTTLNSSQAAMSVAAGLEDDCAVAARGVLRAALEVSPSTAGAAQAATGARDALTDAAIRATHWRKLINPATATVPFPGI